MKSLEQLWPIFIFIENLLWRTWTIVIFRLHHCLCMSGAAATNVIASARVLYMFVFVRSWKTWIIKTVYSNGAAPNACTHRQLILFRSKGWEIDIFFTIDCTNHATVPSNIATHVVNTCSYMSAFDGQVLKGCYAVRQSEAITSLYFWNNFAFVFDTAPAAKLLLLGQLGS